MLLALILYLTGTDGAAAARCSAPGTEAAWFPASKTLVVLNNTENPVHTDAVWPGGRAELDLEPMETRILEGM